MGVVERINCAATNGVHQDVDTPKSLERRQNRAIGLHLLRHVGSQKKRLLVTSESLTCVPDPLGIRPDGANPGADVLKAPG